MELVFCPRFEKSEVQRTRKLTAAGFLESLETFSQVVQLEPVGEIVVVPSLRNLAKAMGVTAPAFYNSPFVPGIGYADKLSAITGLQPVETHGLILVRDGAKVIDYTDAVAEEAEVLEPHGLDLGGLSESQLRSLSQEAAARLEQLGE